MQLNRGFRIGQWLVRPTHCEIEDSERTLHLEPKVMEVLVALAEMPQEVVLREILLERVWGSRAAVSDEPLTRCIAQLRQALGDSWRNPQFIETVPKRGYRLKVDVRPAVGETPDSEVLPDADPTPLAIRSMPNRRTALGVAIVALTAIAIGTVLATTRFFERQDNAAPFGAPNTVAVLPFENLTEDAENDYVGDGIAEDILRRLSRLPGLRVVARSSSFSFRGTETSVREIAQRLRVSYVLQGFITADTDGIRITTDLVDSDGFQRWTDSFRVKYSEFEDLFPAQNTITTSIVGIIQRGLDEPVESRGAIPTTTNRDAWMLVQRARRQIAQRDQGSLRRAVALLKRAMQADTGYGEAYVELARAYALLPSRSAFETEEELFNLALATLAEGEEMDSSVQQSRREIEAIISFERWDWIWADTAFRDALAVAPADADLLQSYANFLATVGRLDDSLDAALRAQILDPESPVINDRLAVSYMWLNRDADALQQFETARELGLGDNANREAYLVLELRLGEYDEVRSLLIGLQGMFVRPTEWIDPFLAALQDTSLKPFAVETLSRAAAERNISMLYLFGAWVYLGELDSAMEAAFELIHDPQSFLIEFLFSREAEEFRKHPRFGALLRQLGLERYWDQFGWPEMCRRDGPEIVCD